MIRNTPAAVLFTATITATALTQATYVRAASKYDGNWSLVVITKSGPCDASYRLSGQIVNGAILYDGAGVDLSGRVRPNGAAFLRVSGGGASAVANGRLTAKGGKGVWRGQNSNGLCSGTWTAMRV